MVGVGLRTDQRAIQMQVNLFDDGMGQIVDGPQFFIAATKLSLSSFSAISIPW